LIPATDSGELKGRKVFFFCKQKGSKKTSLIWARAGENARASESKSFLLLFYKKEVFLTSALNCSKQ
jgi:hypothetical protein